MRVLLFPVGSAGDVHPVVAIGRRLRDRGHDVTLFANAYHAPLAERAGLPFVETEPAAVHTDLEQNADLWHPIKSVRALFGQPGLPAVIRRQYQLVRDHYLPGETVAVGGTIAFGPRVARDHLGVPLVTVHLAPAAFAGTERPPAYATGPKRWWPRWATRLFFWIGDRFLLDPVIGPTVNGFRAELGLPPVRRILTRWLHSPDRVLGLFPDWFAAPAPDWPPQVRLTGFPLYDAGGGKPLAPEVEAFLAAGPPPVVVTFGSAMKFAHEPFAAAVEALGTLGRRGILLTPHAEQVPKELPAGVVRFDYVPFGSLLSRAAALVHHGGIGTSAQGLAAGVPQLVMPLAHDQPDNAERLRRLGVGRALVPKRFTAANVARELTALDTDEARTACRAAAQKFVGTDPIGQTCELIEEVGKKGCPRA